MSHLEIDPTLAQWAFKGCLPYGTYPEAAVEEINTSYEEHISEPVALSHFFTRMAENKFRLCPFPKEDVVQGDFEGFELLEERLYFPIGIRMNVNLVPGSSPGIRREEVVPLWDEKTQSLKVPNFYYQRRGGSIWRKILESKVKVRF